MLALSGNEDRVGPKQLVALLIRSVAPAQRNIGIERQREGEKQRKHDLINKQEILRQSIKANKIKWTRNIYFVKVEKHAMATNTREYPYSNVNPTLNSYSHSYSYSNSFCQPMRSECEQLSSEVLRRTLCHEKLNMHFNCNSRAQARQTNLSATICTNTPRQTHSQSEREKERRREGERETYRARVRDRQERLTQLRSSKVL